MSSTQRNSQMAISSPRVHPFDSWNASSPLSRHSTSQVIVPCNPIKRLMKPRLLHVRNWWKRSPKHVGREETGMGTLLIRVVGDTGKSRHVSSAAVEEVATGVATTSRRPVPTVPITKTSSDSIISMHVTRSTRLHCAQDGGVLFVSSCVVMGGNAEEFMVVSTMVPRGSCARGGCAGMSLYSSTSCCASWTIVIVGGLCDNGIVLYSMPSSLSSCVVERPCNWADLSRARCSCNSIRWRNRVFNCRSSCSCSIVRYGNLCRHRDSRSGNQHSRSTSIGTTGEFCSLVAMSLELAE